MKLTKKKVLSIALVVCLIAILSMGTLAWFTDDDAVTNQFLIADSDDDTADEIFSVDVWENTPEGDEDQDGAEYADILPGDQLKKEAKVENTGAYDQYVRVTITISDAAAWINAMGGNYDPANLLVGFDATKWVHGWNNLVDLQPGDPLPENLVYVLYLKDVLEVGDVEAIFDSVKIPETLTREQAALFNSADLGDKEPGFTVDIKAEAVQTANVVPEGTAAEDAAYEAFKTCGL